MKSKKPNLKIIGWREWVALPKLGINNIKAKIDTGAKTSALHAIKATRYRENLQDKVKFIVHPQQRCDHREVICKAKLLDLRNVTNSGGSKELRYVIETNIQIGADLFIIELTLTNRASMGFRMLLGRSALKNQYLINPSASFLMKLRNKNL